MRFDRPPYWYWGLDRWNALIAVALLAAILITNASTGVPPPAPAMPIAPAPATPAAAVAQVSSTPVAATATVPPPTFANLAEGAQLAPGVSMLSGTAPAGAVVRLFAGDRLIGETMAGPDGRWSMPLPALAPGEHTLIVRAFGADNALLAESAGVRVNVIAPTATAAPPTATPTFTAAPFTPTATATPVPPTATPTATAVPPTAAPTATPTFTAVPPTPTATATSVPPTATATAPSPTATSIPTLLSTPTAAAAPAVPPGVEVVTLAEGTAITLAGTAAPGTRLRIYDGETPIGEVVTDTEGRWTLAIPSLTAGQHVFTARAYDASGQLVSMSEPLYINVLSITGVLPTATPAPPAGTPAGGQPQIVSPQPGAQLPTAAPGLLEGTAKPGTTIHVYDGDRLIAEVVAGPDGTWKVILPLLAEGPHTLTVRPVASDGMELPVAAALPITVVPGPAAAAATPAPGGGALRITSPTAGSTVLSSQPLLAGVAPGRSTVRVYDGDVLLGETQADAQGRWYLVPSVALGIGKHALRPALLDANGQEVAGKSVEIVVAEGATGLKPLTFVPSSGKAPSPIGLLQGVAPPDTLVGVYEGNTLLARLLADARGRWQYALPARTQPGRHDYRIVVTTLDGVLLYQSELIPITISYGPPRVLPVTGARAQKISV